MVNTIKSIFSSLPDNGLKQKSSNQFAGFDDFCNFFVDLHTMKTAGFKDCTT